MSDARVETYLLDDHGALRAGGIELLPCSGTLWIDVLHANAAVLDTLGRRFGLHPLALEDCLHLDQRPKLERYPGHSFVVLQGVTPDPVVPLSVQVHEIHFFIGPGWIISVHENEHPNCESVRSQVREAPSQTLGRGVDHILYLLADALVDHHFPLLDTLDDELDALEEQMFERGSEKQLHRAFHVRRRLALIRRVLSPQRDVVALLAREGQDFVQPKTGLYFRDVYDHLIRLHEHLDTQRELLGALLDGYLSATANRTGEVTKQLTLWATIFMPLSFVVGFFGQNFPALGRPELFWVMVVLVATIPPTMAWWFYRKQWL